MNSMIFTTPLTSRTRTNSSGSASSESSEESKPVVNYEIMNLEDMLADKLDISVFENTRMFNPRKQRSCHKRAEPVSEEKRKEESSKNSREYTKRNRDEIKVCQALRNDLHSKKIRLSQLVADLRMEVVERKIFSAIHDFELILTPHFTSGSDIRNMMRVPNVDVYMREYRLAATKAENIQFTTEIDSQEKRLEELRKELEELENKKDNLASQKEKTNYASSKSRLKQRVIRAELKVECYYIWKQIECLKLRGAQLNECCNSLKKKIWENVLSIYYSFSQSIKSVKNDIESAQHIDRIVMYFAPYSHQIKEEMKPPKVKYEFEFNDKPSPISPTSETKSSISSIQDSNISTTVSPFASTPVSYAPSALSSPSYTLSLPTISMPYVSPQTEEKKPMELLLPAVTVTDEGTTKQILPERKPVSLVDIFNQENTEDNKEDVCLSMKSNDLKMEHKEEVLSSRKRSITPTSDESEYKRMRSSVTPTPITPISMSPVPPMQAPLMTEPMFPLFPPTIPQMFTPQMDVNTAMFTMLYNQLLNSPSTLSPDGFNALQSQLQIANWLQYLSKSI